MRRSRAGVAAVLASLGVPVAAHATTYYAAPSTANTVSCTTQATACDLTDAIQTAAQVNGDEVVVLPGTYNLGSGGITASKAISIHGEAGSPMPEIDAATATPLSALLQLNGGPGTSVSDLKLVQGGNDGPPQAIKDSAGGVHLDRLRVEMGSAAQGVAVVLGSGSVLANSVVSDPNADGVAVEVSQVGVATLENVTAYSGGVAVFAAGPFGAGNAEAKVENSILHGAAAGDLRTANSVGGSGTASIVVDHSDFATAAGTIDASGGGNVSTPAALVDPANGDFHELASSPTVDTGLANALTESNELDSLPRTLGAGLDMGAYELPVPKATTGVATVTGTSATLDGTVNPETTAMTCQFQYGTSAAYGSTVPCIGPLGSGAADLAVSGQLTGLQKGDTYHYRIVAAAASGTGNGADATFTVPAPAPPAISFATPAGGATYFRHQVLDASYLCTDAPDGPGISSCTGTAAKGAPIDTAHTGSHAFTVTATSSDGQQVSTTVHYNVVLPNNSFKVTHIRAAANGTVSFVVTVPGPGAVDVLESARNDNLATLARVLPPGHARFAFARKHVAVAKRGGVKVVVKPSVRGKRLVRHPAYPVRLRLQVSYRPTGGLQHDKSFGGIHLSR